jgi:hypothetical protein
MGNGSAKRAHEFRMAQEQNTAEKNRKTLELQMQQQHDEIERARLKFEAVLIK